ncbi:MAG: hypothetical protein KAS32_28945, partial [Candidatus Peribacteraceae bacterium]|nr:hypothetical protein [Candidatus Peribacteraceae bacterium]
SVKYAGVIGAGLKRNDLIINAKDSDLYSNGLLANKIEEKMHYVFDNYDTLVKEINIEVVKQKDKSMKQIDDIAKKIREG